jgi:hypothetical protein
VTETLARYRRLPRPPRKAPGLDTIPTSEESLRPKGFTVIPNEMLDKLIGSRLNGTEYAVMLALIRNTPAFQIAVPVHRQHGAETGRGRGNQ